MKHYILATFITICLITIGMMISFMVGHYGKIIVEDDLIECRDKIKKECVCY